LTRKVDYYGWGTFGDNFSSRLIPRLTDNFGNSYRRVNFGPNERVNGQVRLEALHPGKSVGDLVVFEVPIDKVEYLRLELPAGNFGGTGKLRLQIPKTMIRR